VATAVAGEGTCWRPSRLVLAEIALIWSGHRTFRRIFSALNRCSKLLLNWL